MIGEHAFIDVFSCKPQYSHTVFRPSRRTAQDRLAETIVVEDSGYRARFGL
jgi:hypothetical protein